jgi:hypothetical protein
MSVERVRDGEGRVLSLPATAFAATIYKWLNTAKVGAVLLLCVRAKGQAVSQADSGARTSGLSLDQRRIRVNMGLIFGLWTRQVVAELVAEGLE